MAKSKTTVTQGYYQGEAQIAAFMKKEFDDKLIKKDAEVERLREEVRNKFTIKQMNDPANKEKMKELFKEPDKESKDYHYQLFKSFRNYGDTLRKLFSTENKKIDMNTLDSLLKANRQSQNHKLFKENLTWNSASGKKAVEKYADLILKNDQRKLEYYKECLKKTKKPINLKDVLDAPTPACKPAHKLDVREIADKMFALEEKLKRTEGLMHANSNEYKAMQAAIKAVNQAFEERTPASKLGSLFEKLQAASMD